MPKKQGKKKEQEQKNNAREALIKELNEKIEILTKANRKSEEIIKIFHSREINEDNQSILMLAKLDEKIVNVINFLKESFSKTEIPDELLIEFGEVSRELSPSMIGSLKEFIKKVIEVIGKSVESNRTYYKEKELFKSENKSLIDDNKQLRYEIETLKAENKRLRFENEKKDKNDVEKAENLEQSDEPKKQLITKETNDLKLLERIKELEKELDTLKNENSSMSSEIKIIKTNFEIMEKQKKQAIDISKEFRKKLDTSYDISGKAIKERNDIAKILENSQSDCAKMKKQLVSKDTEMKDISKTFNSKIDTLKKENDSNVTKIKNLEKEKTNLNDRLKNMDQQLTTSNTEKEELTNALKEANEQLKILTDQNKKTVESKKPSNTDKILQKVDNEIEKKIKIKDNKNFNDNTKKTSTVKTYYKSFKEPILETYMFHFNNSTTYGLSDVENPLNLIPFVKTKNDVPKNTTFETFKKNAGSAFNETSKNRKIHTSPFDNHISPL